MIPSPRSDRLPAHAPWAPAIVVCLAVAAPAAAQTTVIDIDPTSPRSSLLYDVNNRGQAVGQAEIDDGDDRRAVVWQDGRLTALVAAGQFFSSVATSINERGQIVGTVSDGMYSRAVLWHQGGMTDLTPPGWRSCAAAAINDRGDVAGACNPGSGSDVAVRWRGGTMTAFDVLPDHDSCAADAINDAGVVVGACRNVREDRSTAFRWADGKLAALPLPPGAISAWASEINAAGTIVGTATGPSGTSPQPIVWRGTTVTPLSGTWGSVVGTADGINDRGDIVGVTFGGIGGFVWSDGIFKPLESPFGSLPQAISDRGVAVGFIFTAGGPPLHGAVWPKELTRVPPRNPRDVPTGPTPTFLGTLGGASSEARRINGRGQIIGYSAIAPDRDERHPFLWENGVMRDLSADPGGLGVADDINDAGYVVGAAADNDAGLTYAALWNNGVTGRLPLLPGSNNCRATTINQGALVAGFCAIFPDPLTIELVGVFWRHGVIERIPVEAGLQLYPLDVNDAETVIGIAFRGSDVFNFQWQNGVLTNINQAAGGVFTDVVAVNNRGEVVGWGPGDALVRALIWDGQTTRVLGDPSASNIPYGINELGEVAGGSNRSAAVWSNGRTIGLAPPRGYGIAVATGINDTGDVAGNVSVSSTPFVWQAVVWRGVTGAATRTN